MALITSIVVGAVLFGMCCDKEFSYYSQNYCLFCSFFFAVGREFRVASISRRLFAEFIDFILVFSVKLMVSLVALDYGYKYVF